jgi:glycosyltransferase involved in cell wall biosynthesis
MSRQTAASGVQRVALVGASATDLLDLTQTLIRRIVDLRHKPHCLAADLPDDVRPRYGALGATIGHLPLEATNGSPLAWFRRRRRTRATFRTLAPHAVATFDLPSAAAVAPAARRAGVGRIVAVLPHVLDADTPQEEQLRRALNGATEIVVSTPEDRRRLEGSPWLKAGLRISVSPQAGIDLARVAAARVPFVSSGVAFLLTAPQHSLVALETYCEAAHRVATVSATARFHVLGALPDGPDRILAEAALRRAPGVVRLFDRLDPTEAIAQTHVYVHTDPAPRLTSNLLTALAIGRPAIVADVPGPRDCVDEVVNGLRVPPGNAKALAEAMLVVLRRADLLAAMGHASRLKAERRFSATAVHGAIIAALGLDAGLVAE